MRIMEHIGEDRVNYFTHALTIVTTDDSFGSTEISYLENRFCQLIQDAGRLQLANGNEPSLGKVTEEKEA